MAIVLFSKAVSSMVDKKFRLKSKWSKFIELKLSACNWYMLLSLRFTDRKVIAIPWNAFCGISNKEFDCRLINASLVPQKDSSEIFFIVLFCKLAVMRLGIPLNTLTGTLTRVLFERSKSVSETKEAKPLKVSSNNSLLDKFNFRRETKPVNTLSPT